MSNNASTIEARMQAKGLPYAHNCMHSPHFMLSGANGHSSAVVAIWRDSETDDEITFVGFHGDDEAEAIAREAKRTRGVWSVSVVKSHFV